MIDTKKATSVALVNTSVQLKQIYNFIAQYAQAKYHVLLGFNLGFDAHI